MLLAKEFRKADTSRITRKWIDVPYGNISSAQKLDIYLPERGDGPFPVIMSIHGGAFMGGDKGNGQLNPILKGLTAGYAVVGVNYRLSGEATFPAQIYDIKSAIRFIRKNGKAYKLNPDKIAVWGGSAGGTLAALAGTSGDVKELSDGNNAGVSDRVQAVVDWFGPIYFSTMDAEFAALGMSCVRSKISSPDSPESAYLGKTIGTQEAENTVKKASPLTYISPDDPPFYIQHGTMDMNIPVTQSENFAGKLESVIGSDKVIFEKIEGAKHGGPEFFKKENLRKIFAFLDKYLK